MITLDLYRGAAVGIFGLSRTGLSAARALRAGGARPVLWDDSAARRLAAQAEGFDIADFVTGPWPDGMGTLVLSPGVPLTHPEPHAVVRAAQAAGAEIVGDIDLFARHLAAMGDAAPKLVAITGTNGKSTTTALIGHIFAALGRPVAIGGNIGRGVLDLDPLPPNGVYVIEMSSYQIDLAPHAAADVVCLMNITPDHLDRHGSLANYAAVKHRLVSQRKPGAPAIIGIDDDFGHLARAQAGSVVTVSVTGRDAQIAVRHGQMRDTRGAGFTADLSVLKRLPGQHNWQNIAIAFGAVRALGGQPAEIMAAIATFPGLAHRMEDVGRLGRVRFINDSKATNADAAAKALDCFDPIYWIAGGRAKDGGIASLEPWFGRIAKAYLIGEAAADFAAALRPRVACDLSGTLDVAVAAASRDASVSAAEEPVVLLSPACASFDQFADFEARGEAFRAAVSGVLARGAA